MRIAGITIPQGKHLSIALTAVYGVGRSQAEKILLDCQVAPTLTAEKLTPDQEQMIREKIEAMRIEGDLRRHVSRNIKRLKDIGSLRGDRHARGLPTRGQRTRTNGRTRKGPRKTMGSGRVKADKK